MAAKFNIQYIYIKNVKRNVRINTNKLCVYLVQMVFMPVLTKKVHSSQLGLPPADKINFFLTLHVQLVSVCYRININQCYTCLLFYVPLENVSFISKRTFNSTTMFQCFRAIHENRITRLSSSALEGLKQLEIL